MPGGAVPHVWFWWRNSQQRALADHQILSSRTAPGQSLGCTRIADSGLGSGAPRDPLASALDRESEGPRLTIIESRQAFPPRGQDEPLLGRSPRPTHRDEIPGNQDDQQDHDGNQEIAAWMSIPIAGNLTVEELVDDDSRDNNRKADPPVATNAVAESLGHIWRIRPPGDLTFPSTGAGALGTSGRVRDVDEHPRRRDRSRTAAPSVVGQKRWTHIHLTVSPEEFVELLRRGARCLARRQCRPRSPD